MLEVAALQVLIYSVHHPVLTLLIALLGGYVASRILDSDRRPRAFGFTIIGVLGFFLNQFVLSFYQVFETFDGLNQLRIFIDLVAAIFGSFVIASSLHFLKPV